MKMQEKQQIERALCEYYRQDRRNAAAASEGHVEAVAALAVAKASNAATRSSEAGDFLRAALRFSPRTFWLAPAAVIVLAIVLACAGAPAHEAEVALAASGSVLVMTCLVSVVRTRSHLMQELEASCLHNAVSVACARLAVFGGATLAALALSCAACIRILPFGAAAAYALAPYLIAAAGGLMLARKVASTDTTVVVVAWSASVGALCILMRFAAPALYGDAALWVWAAASAAGALWCAREVVCWLRFCTQGGITLESAQRAGNF